MKYYINGTEVTREEIKLQSYIEEYRFSLIKIFIIKYTKKNIHKIIAWLLVLIWILISISLVNANNNVEPLKNDDLRASEVIDYVTNIKEVKEVLEVNKTSYEKFMEEWERLHKIKYEEQKKADVEERAFEFIVQFEWFYDKPYWDYKQWSCGYWMRCSKNTTWITKEKSKWFVIERIKLIRSKNNLEKYNDNMGVALISFIYNIWHAPVWMDCYIKNNYTNALKNMMRKYSYAWGKYMRWLANRRNAETNLF